MIEKPFVIRLLCVALVAAVMLPLGECCFPISAAKSAAMQFHALEAVFSATLGFGIYGVFG